MIGTALNKAELEVGWFLYHFSQLLCAQPFCTLACAHTKTCGFHRKEILQVCGLTLEWCRGMMLKIKPANRTTVFKIWCLLS